MHGSDATNDQQLAEELVARGEELRELHRLEEAIGCLDGVLAQFGAATDPGVREQVAGAMLVKGEILDDLGRHHEALVTYEEVLGRFGRAREPAVRELVATALVNKGLTLGDDLGRPQAELDVYEELLTWFGDALEDGVREQVAKGLLYTVTTLTQLDLPEDALGACDELLARFGDAQDPSMRELVAAALIGKAEILDAGLGRPLEAIVVYDEILTRSSAAEPHPREQIAKTLVAKAGALEQLERYAEAVETYDDLLARFGDTTESEPELSVLVRVARIGKSVALIKTGRHAESLALSHQLLGRLSATLNPRIEDPSS